MNFYTYDYFVYESNNNQVYKYLLVIVILLLLLLVFLRRTKKKERSKYRDLIMLFSLVLVFLVGIQFNGYQKGKVDKGNLSQMIVFLNSVEKKLADSSSELSVNSRYLKDEMLLKIGDDYYQVNFNNDNSSFGLEETFLVTFFRYLKENVAIVKRLIDGKPTMLIKNGVVLVDECTKKGISANDLMFKLRTSGVCDTTQVKRAIQEQNGQFTIILYGEDNIKFPVITNGYINDDVLEMIDRDKEWLLQELNKQEVDVKNIYLGEWLDKRLVLSLYG